MRFLGHFTILWILITGIIYEASGQANFTTDAELCIGQSLNLDNLSVDGVSYFWDFCPGDLSVEPSSEYLGSYSSNPYSHVTLHENGVWYGFM
ncbi:MAG: hypothetical protein ABJG41_00555, partial [Cyclobacteriaceae bacterium]